MEYACHALGGSVTEYAVGAGKTSALSMFSGHPVKEIAMGEGGVLTTDDESFAHRVYLPRNHGLVRDPVLFVHGEMAWDRRGEPNPWYYELVEPGLNYRASDIHCALGLSQFAKLERLVVRRRELAALYDYALAPLRPVVRPVPRVAWGKSGWHLYAVPIDFGLLSLDRAGLMHRLRASGIGTQVHYMPVHRQPYYRGLNGDAELPGADAYYARCLSLPLYPAMTNDNVQTVVSTLTDVLRS